MIFHYIDAIGGLFLVMLSQLGQMIVYDWDGESPQGERVAFVDMCGGSQGLAVGAQVGPFGWHDLRKSGNPYADVMMTTYAGSGVREIEIAVDYGEMVVGVMHVVARQQEISTEPITYGPFVGIHRMSFGRGNGTYIRVRRIKNDGDAVTAVQVRGTGSLGILGTTATADRDVEVV